MEEERILEEGKRALSLWRGAIPPGSALEEELERFERLHPSALYRYCFDLFGGAPEAPQVSGGIVEKKIPAQDGVYAEALSAATPQFQNLLDDLALFFRERLENDSLGEYLNQLLAERHMTAPEVYKRAQVDRRYFSAMRKSANEIAVSKSVALCLAVGFCFTPNEAHAFLRRLGYAFNPRNQSDMVVLHCLGKGVFDMDVINGLLVSYGQDTLPK